MSSPMVFDPKRNKFVIKPFSSESLNYEAPLQTNTYTDNILQNAKGLGIPRTNYNDLSSWEKFVGTSEYGGLASPIFSGVEALGNLYLGMKNYGLQKEANAEARRMNDFNMKGAAANYNMSLDKYERVKGATLGRSQEDINNRVTSGRMIV